MRCIYSTFQYFSCLTVLTSVNKGALMSASDTLLICHIKFPKNIFITILCWELIWWYNTIPLLEWGDTSLNEEYADDSLLWTGKRLKWGFPSVEEFEIDRVFLLPPGEDQRQYIRPSKLSPFTKSQPFPQLFSCISPILEHKIWFPV